MLNVLQRVGWLLFASMWVPFIFIFVGMAPELGSAGRDFAAWVDQIVPGLFTVLPCGATLLTTVAFALTFALLFTAMAFLFGTPLWAAYRNRVVLRSGRPAEGRIVSAVPTGVRFNHNPVTRITLEVTPSDGRPFLAETEMVIKQAQIPQIQPDTVVPVRYNPDTLEVAIGEGPGR